MPVGNALIVFATNDNKENDLSKDHALSSFQRISCFYLDRLKIKDFVCKWIFLSGECQISE